MKQVEMLEKRFGYFPQRFQVGDVTYTALAIRRTWTTHTRPPKLVFEIRTEHGIITLSQNTATNKWRTMTPKAQLGVKQVIGYMGDVNGAGCDPDVP
jgi:hypothetical protein